MKRRSRGLAFALAIAAAVLTWAPATLAAPVLAEVAQLAPSDEFQPKFSSDVAIDGSIAVVGAPGQSTAYVYERDPAGVWSSGTPLNPICCDGSFGQRVAISGNTIVVAAGDEDVPDPNNTNQTLHWAGAAYVFVKSGSSWALQQKLTAAQPKASAFFGSDVAIDGDTIVVGAVQAGASDVGAIYVFDRSAGHWSESAIKTASNAAFGDGFGSSVGIDGDTIVAGAYAEQSKATGVNGDETDNSLPYAGAAYVFVRNLGAWSQQAYLKPSVTRTGFIFGDSVAVSGDTIAVGAAGEDSAGTGVGGNQAGPTTDDSGAVYVFVRSGTTWSQQAYIKASNANADDEFGGYVSLDGNDLIAGSAQEDSASSGINGNQADNTLPYAGAAYILHRSGTSWSQTAYLKESPPHNGDLFGGAVDVSSGTFLVGALRDDLDDISNVGQVHVFTTINDTIAPVTTDIHVSLREGGQIASAPLTVTWDATDNSGSPGQFVYSAQVRNRTSSGWSSWRDLTLAPHATTLNVSINLSTKYQFRVRTTDGAGNVGAWANSNIYSAAAKQEWQFTRTGHWTVSNYLGAMGKVARSDFAASNAHLSFRGTGIAAVMPVQPSYGSARICVDKSTSSETCRTLNLGSMGSANRVVVGVMDGLALRAHTLDVTVMSGVVVYLDAAIVFKETAP